MTITKHQVVTLEYTLKNDQGEVLDTSEGAEPLSYIHGLGHIVPGLEKALEGKSQGEKFKVTIPPEEGYGERIEQMVQSVPKSEFKDLENLAPGIQFEIETEQGPLLLTVLEVGDTEVLLDGNHPLAGMPLHFEVEISTIRKATDEEISHGHIHGEGAHQH